MLPPRAGKHSPQRGGVTRDPIHPVRAKLLVVDDDRIVASTLHQIFLREGFEVSVCHDGNDAITALQAEAPDLLILDHSLPGTKGLEVADAARKLNHTCLVFVLSGLVGYELPDDGALRNNVEFVRKPVPPAELLVRVRRRLSGKVLSGTRCL